MLKNDADPNIRNDRGISPLIIAVGGGHYSLVKLLLKSGANPNFVNKNEDTPLMCVVINKNHLLMNYKTLESYKIAKLLIKAGANVNMKNSEGNSALIIYLRENNHHKYAKLKFLLENNADPNIQNNYGDTALIIATRLLDLEAVKLLLKYNSDIPLKNNNEESALTMSIKNLELLKGDLFKKNVYIIRELLSAASFYDIVSLFKNKVDTFKDNNLFEILLEAIIEKQIPIKVLLYDNNLNEESVLFILKKVLTLREELKNKILENINTFFSYDQFLLKNKNLLIESFFNVVKLYKLEKVEMVKDIKEILINSLTSYYEEKMNNIEKYQERYLENLSIIKKKINVFIVYLYSHKTIKEIDVKRLSSRLNNRH